MTWFADVAPVIVLLVGSGAGLAGLAAVFRLGKREQQQEDRGKKLDDLDAKRAGYDDAVREIAALKLRTSMCERNIRIGSDHEARLVIIEKVFSRQFPRVSAEAAALARARGSRPEIFEGEPIDDDENERKRER